MSGIAVRAEALSKRFYHTLPRYHTLLGRLRGGSPRVPVWALRDLSFELERGGCLGVTGPNGAGKSTLLALVAGILEPTGGRLEVFGRAGALLNLRSGLQPELAVRENLEIAGILMGLRRRQALERLDEVLDFAGLSERADVRLAELSAGQAARLVFSAAVHSDSDILLIDELLAVGDAAFSDKCVAALGGLRAQGKTLLVASHDEGLLDRLGARRLRLGGGLLEAAA